MNPVIIGKCSLYLGDCLDVLKTMADESVQMCVTSPPYFGLRDYQVEGQIGLERTPAEYVAKLISVFHEVKRVLKTDGVCFLNLGDSYCANQKGGEKAHPGDKSYTNHGGLNLPKVKTNYGMKPKDLIGIPWMVAFALRADSWYLRSEIIWAKPNPMPESVKDRPTKSHEQIFLLSKSQIYYYDYKAILEPANYDGRKDTMMKGGDKGRGVVVPGSKPQSFAIDGHERWAYSIKSGQTGDGHSGYVGANGNLKLTQNAGGESARNKRDVWTVNTQPFKGAHFAVFPEDLIKPCILAGSKRGDTVLDPFNGAGTTGVVCRKFGRDFIGIDLNPKYIEMSRRRISGTPIAML